MNAGEVNEPHPRPTSNISPSFINQAGQQSRPIDDDTTIAISIKKKEMLDIRAAAGGGDRQRAAAAANNFYG